MWTFRNINDTIAFLFSWPFWHWEMDNSRKDFSHFLILSLLCKSFCCRTTLFSLLSMTVLAKSLLYNLDPQSLRCVFSWRHKTDILYLHMKSIYVLYTHDTIALVVLCDRYKGRIHLINVYFKYMGYYSFTDPKEMKGWVGLLVGWPIADSLAMCSYHSEQCCWTLQDALFMDGLVAGVSTLTSQPWLSQIQQRVQSLCGWKRSVMSINGPWLFLWLHSICNNLVVWSLSLYTFNFRLLFKMVTFYLTITDDLPLCNKFCNHSNKKFICLVPLTSIIDRLTNVFI